MSAIIASPALAAASASNEDRPVYLKVMTRNLYLGADLLPVLTAPNVSAFIGAVTRTFAMVRATNFTERVEAIAEEIEAFSPDVIGLQEVEIWRTQTPADFNTTPNALHVEYDYLELLIGALSARGLSYEAVATVTNYDAEAPRWTGSGYQDVRLTDRDALLVRSDLPARQLSVSNASSGHYAHNLVVRTAVGATISLGRGWVAADISVRGRAVHVVDTHLENALASLNEAQGQELLDGPVDPATPVVLLGDFNSAADGSSTETYQNLIDAGLSDAWAQEHPDADGYSCCQAENLANSDSALHERVDFVFFAGGVSAHNAELIGEQTADRTVSGLWPSDHAGLAAKLGLP